MSAQAPWVGWDRERKFMVRNPPENMKRSCSEDGLFWPYLSPAVQTLLSLVLIFYCSVVCRGEAETLEDGVASSLPRTETEISCFFSNGENPEASLKGGQR